MAGTEVSSVIRDIIDAFKNGLGVLRKTGRRHKRRHSEPANTTEEKRLHDSLSLRPQEIQLAYDQSVVRHGRQFEVGDSTSQRSLAQILLVLNAGLIRLLNHALDHKSRPQSRNSFFSLSETAAMDTLNALSELNVRLISSSRIDLGLPAPTSETAKATNLRKQRPRAESAVQASKRPPISPQLRQHGGYIRSKSDPSVVTVVLGTKNKKGDQKQIPDSQFPGGHRANRSTDTSPTRTPESKSPPPRYSQMHKKPTPPLSPEAEDSHPKPEVFAQQRQRNGHTGQPVRQPSMYIVPAEFFNQFPQSDMSHYFTQQEDILGPLPLVPPKVPLHSRPQPIPQTEQTIIDAPRHRRERPPSMMTFMTASTKIGEIPEHRLPDFVPTGQPQQAPEQYVNPEMLYPLKKKGKGLKFWKKDKYERSPLETVAA